MDKAFAFVFPGQGSQSLGMLQALAAEYPIVHETFAIASTALNYDLWQLVQQGPPELLNQTARTQPALLAASVAIWKIWLSQKGLLPAVLAGHSVGEYSALVCAQALDFQQAIKLVAKRGELMQAAVPEGEGAMAAIIGLDENKIEELCHTTAQNQVLAPANFNANGQIVVAGHTAAVERVIILAKQAGAKLAKLLAVSVPSHCSLMQPAADELAAYLTTIELLPPHIPVINNVDVAIENDPEKIKNALVRQLYSPVRWVETIHSIVAKNIYVSIECGPGKVLAGLNKRIVPEMKTLGTDTPELLKVALEKMHGGLRPSA